MQRSFVLKLGTTLLPVLAAMATTAHFETHETAFLVCFVLIPQLWLAYTEPPLATATSLATSSLLIIVLLNALDLPQFAFVYQLAIAIVATTAYFGLAIPLLEDANRQLRQKLMFDPLTGAASREYLREKAERLFGEPAQAAGTRRDSLAVLDVDHFKRVNDSHGHSLGE